uniref:Uncharacterized protein n=2 Tax=Anguilla anguilla TaxID=7936 RepID=A0A0E9QYJ0_ANGAN
MKTFYGFYSAVFTTCNLKTMFAVSFLFLVPCVSVVIENRLAEPFNLSKFLLGGPG